MRTYKNTDGKLEVTDEVVVSKTIESLRQQKQFIHSQMDVLQAKLEAINF